MGAGRKTETYTLAPHYGPMNARNLKKGDLCGVIFGCKFSTIKECYAKKLFGLPAPHMTYIKNIEPGLPLFLFNYSDRTLNGVYEAASEGKMNIDPEAWSLNGTDPSPYPAQVKVKVRVRCESLPEEIFSTAFAENYSDEKMFWFELDSVQTNKLIRLFTPLPSARVPLASNAAAKPSRKAIPAASLAQIGDPGAKHVDKWSSLFKSSDVSSEKKEQDSKEGTQGAGSRSIITHGKAQPSVTLTQPDASFSSVVNKQANSSTLEKKTPLTNEVSSQASKAVQNPWSSASQVPSSLQDNEGFRNAPMESVKGKVNALTISATTNNVIGPRKQEPVDDTCSDFDWDASSSFKANVYGVNSILDDPTDKLASSSMMVPSHWEERKEAWEFEERNIAKSPCGSSYVSANTGDAIDDIGRMDVSTVMIDILSNILSEIKELKHVQLQQAERMISLEMGLIESRREILRLKGRNA